MFCAGLKTCCFDSSERVHPAIADLRGCVRTKLVGAQAMAVDLFAGAITEEVIVTDEVDASAANTHATFTRFSGVEIVVEETRGF